MPDECLSWVKIDKTRSEQNESALGGIATNPPRGVSIRAHGYERDRLSAHISRQPLLPRLGGERLRTVRTVEYRVALRLSSRQGVMLRVSPDRQAVLL